MKHQFLEPGIVIDGYRLEEKCHKGGMATLWRVVDCDPARSPRDAAGHLLPLLMKAPLLRDHDDPAAIVGFEEEQMIMPKLTGVHVPRCIATGDFLVHPYIVMEQIGGNSLRAKFDAAPLPPDEVAAIGAKIATALHELHRQHVIHHDIKPSNIMFRSSGEAVFIDFGLSRHEKLPDLLAEEFRLPMGTAPYISPEQVLHIRNEPRSDQFALGVLLYHLATGERPFGNPGSVAGLRKRLYRDPVPPRRLNPAIAPWLQEIILRCLEVDARARYDTAAQLAFELQFPDQVHLSARSQKMRRDGGGTVIKRWFRAIGVESVAQKPISEQMAHAPIIVAALDLANGSEALADALRITARRILQIEPGARLACVTVQKTHRIAMDAIVDEEGRNIHVKNLIELKHWARTLNIPPEKITYHVLEAPDPASAIIEYARSNKVDHILIGSRGSSAMRRYLGSVSSQVVAEADCSVTVIKTGENRENQ